MAAVSGVRHGRFVFEGGEHDLMAADARTLDELVDIDIRSGSLSALDDSSIFLHADPARDLGLVVGDRVNVEFASGGPQQLEVAGSFGDSTHVGNYLVDMGLFTTAYPASDLDLLAFGRPPPLGWRHHLRRRRGARPSSTASCWP